MSRRCNTGREGSLNYKCFAFCNRHIGSSLTLTESYNQAMDLKINNSNYSRKISPWMTTFPFLSHQTSYQKIQNLPLIPSFNKHILKHLLRIKHGNGNTLLSFSSYFQKHHPGTILHYLSCGKLKLAWLLVMPLCATASPLHPPDKFIF